MRRRLQDSLTFRLERWLQRGAAFQLLLMAALIGGVAAAGGLIVWAFSPAFGDPGSAVWWAFLRLTDPGYLGDDEGALLRTVSTVVTVLGYVLFMGTLIAILTQWLNQTMRTLERGLTPIALRDHVLILGWTNRTPGIVREVLLSEGRVQRFLRRHGTRRLRIVILAEQFSPVLLQELRDQLGGRWSDRHVIFRSGSSLRIEHLRRVAYEDAAVIILPGADFVLGGAEATDARVIKTLISIANHRSTRQADDLPLPVVAEVFDAQKVPIAQQAYDGELDLVATDAFISRLIAQNVRHRGLSHVFAELLSYASGNEVYVRHAPDFAGAPVHALSDAFPEAILLGAVRPAGRSYRPHLNPPADFTLAEDDRLVLVARTYADTTPSTEFEPGSPVRRRPLAPPRSPYPKRRVLILGWSHKVLALLREFGGYPAERFEVDVLSVVPAAEREAHLARAAHGGAPMNVRQLEGDYTVRADLVAADPLGYDNVVFLGSDWLDSGAESDARTILGYVLLRALLPQNTTRPEVVVELMDPENARLFQQRPGEVIISPLVLSHVLAHVALRRELNAVFGELFGPGGAEISFRPAAGYELTGAEVGFRDVQRAAARNGEIALGLRRPAAAAAPGGGVHLNPPAAARWRLGPGDEVVVLS